MKYAHILHALYEEPWLISASMHGQLCDIVKAHITGVAHAPDGSASYYEEGAGKAAALEVIAGVAVVPFTGVVGQHVGMMEKSSGVMDINDFTTNLQMAIDRDDINGILIDVNSPGGTITGVPEAADMVAEASPLKPIVAFTDSLMASAAYWVCSGVDAIVATQSASVGSIGVFSAILDSSKAFELAGLKQQLFKSGEYKGMGMTGTALTDDQKTHIQNRVTMIYDWFTAAVIDGRGRVGDNSFEGQDFRGEEAKQMNLIDQVGDKDNAFELLLELIAMKK